MFAEIFISTAHAQDAAAAEPSMLASFLPLVLIMAIFYLLILRPQQKKFKQHQTMIGSVKRGDKVLTGGGIIGKVVKVDDEKEMVHVEIAESVTVQVARSTITSVFGKEIEKSAANDATKSPKNKKEKQPVANDN